MFDVICIGSATVDVFAKNKGDIIKIITEKGESDILAFPAGSKVLMEEPIYCTGGGGTNVAVGLRRLGLKVSFLGKIGPYQNGQRIIQNLKKERVDISLILKTKKRGLHTGFSIILENHEKDRAILAYKGANNDIRKDEIKTSRLKTKWLYFGSLMEKSLETLEYISEWAKNNNIQILFNPSSYITNKGIGYIKNIVRNTTVLVCNKEEGQSLSGKTEISDIISEIHSYGPSIVAITDGKKGAYISECNTILKGKPMDKKVIDTTGAGDAFCTGLLAGLITKDLKTGLQYGLVNGAAVVTKMGAKDGLLRRSKIDSLARKIKVSDY
jgi:ribokinase